MPTPVPVALTTGPVAEPRASPGGPPFGGSAFFSGGRAAGAGGGGAFLSFSLAGSSTAFDEGGGGGSVAFSILGLTGSGSGTTCDGTDTEAPPWRAGAGMSRTETARGATKWTGCARAEASRKPATAAWRMVASERPTPKENRSFCRSAEDVADGVHGLTSLPEVSVTMPRFSMPMRFRTSSVSTTVP